MCAAHPNKTVEDFVTLQQNVAAYHVARTAARLGILEELSGGQRTARQLAEALKLDSAGTEMLMWALCETGLAEAYAEDFALSQIGRLLADPRSLDDEHWESLEQWVRIGPEEFARQHQAARQATTENGADALGADSRRATRVFSLQWMEAPAALDAAEVLDFGRSRRGLRVLEVGGGSAVVSAALAHRDPDSRFVVLDRPNDLHRAQQTTASIELENQFDFVAGDPRQPQLDPGSFDLILVAGQFHYVDQEQGPAWIASLARGLKRGGELAVIDWFGGQEKGHRTLAFYQLEIGLRVPGAHLQRPQRLREWMLAAGLNQVRYAHLPSPPYIWGLVLAERGD